MEQLRKRCNLVPSTLNTLFSWGELTLLTNCGLLILTKADITSGGNSHFFSYFLTKCLWRYIIITLMSWNKDKLKGLQWYIFNARPTFVKPWEAIGWEAGHCTNTQASIHTQIHVPSWTKLRRKCIVCVDTQCRYFLLHVWQQIHVFEQGVFWKNPCLLG